VLDQAEMEKLGMGALLGVAQGSCPRAAAAGHALERRRRGRAPIAFVGKGVTFDTGGISIKPAPAWKR
jgi:leucyl aminopeptidase